MDFRHLRCLSGPNPWAVCPVIETAIDLSDERRWSPEQVRRTLDRLRAELPDIKLGDVIEVFTMERVAVTA